jgi:hypothetical protein
MKTQRASRTRLALLAATLLAAPRLAAAQEETLVAGWDFSQYAVENILSLDGATLNGAQVDPNHSDLDPTYRCGIESNAFGRMYYDGSFGSSVAVLDPNFENLDPFRPSAADLGSGSLVSNADQAFLGFGSQAACTIQQIEQMPFANCQDFAMIASGAVSIVFAADRSTAPSLAGDWLVSFAGRTLSAGSTQVGVQFSADGSSFGSAGTATITGADTKFTFPLGGGSATAAYVRLVFPQPTAGSEVLLDNLGIAVPEPSHGAWAAAVALAALFRARRRA